ncbi:MAG: IclR family transcriptional regulator [Actinobacteria bacterium]|nr:IclR family transcriptional regulator [Actinomycetota bacterium]
MSVQSVERSFAILRALGRGPMGVTELADDVGLAKSTVSRLLASLETEGAVEQVEAGGQYQVGEALAELGAAHRGASSLTALARPILVELVEQIGEAAGLSIVDGNSMLYLTQVEAPGEIQVRDWTGETAPIHSVPSGIVAMAQMPRRRLRALLSRDLEVCTPNTVLDFDSLAERCVQARSLGYAWGHEEFVVGITSVAAPVIGAGGDVTAALHVEGPTYRFPNPDQLHDLGLLLAEASDRLAEILQH